MDAYPLADCFRELQTESESKFSRLCTPHLIAILCDALAKVTTW